MVALLVVFTIVICVCADSFVQWRKARRESDARRLADEVAPDSALAGVSAPADVFLDSGHTWVKVAPSGRADVGLDSFAERLIGRVDAVVLPDVGREVRRGDMLFALRQGTHRAAFASPVDGVVDLVDDDLAWHPENIHSDPYHDGWVCALRPTNLSANLKELRTADEAQSWLEQEAARFRDLLAARTADEPTSPPRSGVGLLERAGDRSWALFNDLFLRPAR
jgi:glycine cleavage system H lipoate-binding protein